MVGSETDEGASVRAGITGLMFKSYKIWGSRRGYLVNLGCPAPPGICGSDAPGIIQPSADCSEHFWHVRTFLIAGLPEAARPTRVFQTKRKPYGHGQNSIDCPAVCRTVKRY